MLFKISSWKNIFVFLFIVANLGPQMHRNEIQKQKEVAYLGFQGKDQLPYKILGLIMLRPGPETHHSPPFSADYRNE